MAEARLVKDQALEGQMLIQKLIENGFDVTSACWLLDSERDYWVLCLVSKTIEEKGGPEAQGELQRAFEQLPDLWMDRSEVRLVRPDHRIAMEIDAIRKRYPIKLKDRHHIELGGLSSAEVHIYPVPSHTSAVSGA
jgi:hypothetical protein